MVGASPFLFRSWSYEQAQVAILGLFAISAFLCLLLMKSLMAMIRRDASAQALETLKDMELEPLAAMVQTGQEIEAIRFRIRKHPSVIQDLEEDFPDLYVSRCDNPVADAILFRKSREMKEQNIRSHFQVSLPADLPLDSAILLSLLTNLLDNAILAASQCPSERRFVSLEAGLRRNCLVCICENSVSDNAAITPGLSSKNRPGHGHGLQILEDLCTQQGGQLKGVMENGRCRFTATLWLEEEA